MEKFCRDTKFHKGGKSLPVTDFYLNPTRKDGYSDFCKICQARRATISVKKQRAKRKALGLPTRVTQAERDAGKREQEIEKQRMEDYAERSKARRIAEQLARETVEEEPETVEPSIFTFAGALGVFQRQPDHKCHGWAVMRTGASR